MKEIGRVPDGGGWRIRGETVDHHRSRRDETPIGYDQVHSMIDDHSRLAYSEVRPDDKGATCAAFLHRAIAYFADHGITRVDRLMIDNAWAYRNSLRTVCVDHNITQQFIRPHCPWQNRKVERPNRTLATELAYRQVFTPTSSAATLLRLGWSITTLNAATVHSAAYHRPFDCYQPDGRVQLVRAVARQLGARRPRTVT